MNNPWNNPDKPTPDDVPERESIPVTCVECGKHLTLGETAIGCRPPFYTCLECWNAISKINHPDATETRIYDRNVGKLTEYLKNPENSNDQQTNHDNNHRDG